MTRTLDRTKDIFLDTMLLGNEILIKKIKTTNKRKITVVLAAFRSVTSFANTIVDLFKQSFKDIEILVVDDSSGQDIEEFISVNDDIKINYIKKQLGSNSSAKNCALDFAKGDYIIFIEENVRLEPNYLESLYSLASVHSLDIAMLTRRGYTCSLAERVTTGSEHLVKEIALLKSDLDYNLTSCMFKKKFLDVYNLRFQEDMLSLENLYFKLKAFDFATKVCQSARVGYREIQEKKSIRNQAMIEASTRRIMIATKKIEEFKVGKKYESSLNLLCGYLLFDVLRMYENMSEETELLELIKSKKEYFASDSFVNRTMINMSPILFANHLNRKERI
ncbi:glycosyltransferase family 2 protein [Gemella cuniculi]|uniref:glycosyltransferase family 2 protein n=1 Tax=Gemella cuniculi TaxID=150240 RepID=UPI00041314F7|nr:glycosyltransferase family 2 protein [Gemella cuniculi]